MTGYYQSLNHNMELHVLLSFGEGRTVTVADVWPAGLSSIWPGKEWRTLWNILLHLVETIQRQQCQTHLVVAGGGLGGKDASSEHLRKEQMSYGAREQGLSSSSGVEPIRGDNVRESTWRSVFSYRNNSAKDC